MRIIPTIASAVIAGAWLGVPPASASPYVGDHCDPHSRDYYWSMCKDEFQNDAECSEFGDMQACQQDFSDYQRQQRELSPTPN